MKHLLAISLFLLVGSTGLNAQSNSPFSSNASGKLIHELEGQELLEAVHKLNNPVAVTANMFSLDSTKSFADYGSGLFTEAVNKYGFDERGNTILEEFFIYNDDSLQLFPSNRNTYTYNLDNQQTFFSFEFWDLQTQSYVVSSNQEMLYNNDGRLDSTTAFAYNSFIMAFGPVSSVKYEYDNDGKLLRTTNYYRSDTEWILSYINEYTYNGNLVSSIILSFYNPMNSSFIPNSRFEFAYTNQLVSRRNTSSWDFVNMAWTYTEQLLYVYDGNGNRLSLTQNTYNTNTMSWDSESKTESTYNNDDQLLTEQISNWESNAWVPEDRQLYTYANGNATTYVYDEYDSDNSIWVNVERNLAFVNNNINTNDLIRANPLQFIDAFFTNAPDSIVIESYDESTMQYVNEGYEKFFYSPFTGTVNTREFDHSTSINFFPNPSKNLVQFQMENVQEVYDLEVYDLTGRLIHAQVIRNGQVVTTEDWSTGVYFLSARASGNKVFKSKLIKL